MEYRNMLQCSPKVLTPRVGRIFPRTLASTALFLLLQQVQGQEVDTFQSVAECCDAICRIEDTPQKCLDAVPSDDCPQLSQYDDYCSCTWGVVDIPNNITYTTPRCVMDIKAFEASSPVSGSTAFIVLLALSILLCGCGCGLCWFCFIRVPESDTKDVVVANPGEEEEETVPRTPSAYQKVVKGIRKVGSFQDMKRAIKNTFSSDEEDNDDEERGENRGKKEVRKGKKGKNPGSSGRRALEPPPPTGAGVVDKSLSSVKVEGEGSMKKETPSLPVKANGANGTRKANPPALGQDTSGFGFRTEIYPDPAKSDKSKEIKAKMRRGSAPPTPDHMRAIQLKMGTNGLMQSRSTDGPAKAKSMSPEAYMKRRFSLNPQMARQGSAGSGRMLPDGHRALMSDRALMARQQLWEDEWRRNNGVGGSMGGGRGPFYPKTRSNSMMPLGHVRPPVLDDGGGLMWPSKGDSFRRGSHIPTVREVAMQAQQEVLREQQQHPALDKARRVANRVRRASALEAEARQMEALRMGYPGFPQAFPGPPGLPPHWPPGMDGGGGRPFGGSQGRMNEMLYGAPQAPSTGPFSHSDSRRSMGSMGGPSSTGSSRSLGSARGSNRSLRDLERGGSSRGLTESGKQIVHDIDELMGYGNGGGVFHADKGAYDPARDALRFKLSEPGRGEPMGLIPPGDPLQFMTDSIREGSAESRTNSRGGSPTMEEVDEMSADAERKRQLLEEEQHIGSPEHEAQYKRISSAWEKGQAALSELQLEERLAAERRQGMMRHPGPGPDTAQLATRLSSGGSASPLRKGKKGFSPQAQRAHTPGGNPEEEAVGPRGGPAPVWRRETGQRREQEPAYSVV